MGKKIEVPSDTPFGDDHILRVDAVSVEFGGLKAVDSVSLTVKRGEILGLIGSNGAGKTTLFQAISGFIRKSSGEVFFDGNRIDQLSPEKICKRGLTRTFQISEVIQSLTVHECLTAAALVHLPLDMARSMASSIAEMIQLAGKLDVLCSELTLPDQRVLEIGKAMATQPKMILLDEVMAGLRPSEIQDVMQLVNDLREKRDITFLMVEHNMEVMMNLTNRIVVMTAGQKIAEGLPRDVVEDPKVIETYLGGEIELT